MEHPYRQQPAKAFWTQTISPFDGPQVSDWYSRKFDLAGARIATAGSCFAQHIGRNLRLQGFDYVDLEPGPATLPAELHNDYGYGLYSARYGNVYTARQLLQLLQRALGQFSPLESAWHKDGGVVDPFRPTLEIEPFGSEAEMLDLQRDHLLRVAEMFRSVDVFVFTLGLTEAWLSRVDGAAFPLCPGTAGGAFDPQRHAFHNLTAAQVMADMQGVIALARQINPALKFLLTVSPVPLMATATALQIAVATTYSKSVLRAVAGELCDTYEFVDYFPSYEIITSPFMKGAFYQPDQREVTPDGVAHVMSVFFDAHSPPSADDAPLQRRPPPMRRRPPPVQPVDEDDVRCDEELLNTFGRDTDAP